MSRSVRRILAGGVVAACLALGLTAPAWAIGRGPTPTLAAIKSRAASAISTRLTSLSETIPAVSANRWLTSANKSALTAILKADQSDLTALGPKIQADASATQARTDYESIFLRYRVYALALPQVGLAAAADDITTAALPRLVDAQTRLTALLSGPEKNNAPAVQAGMSDLAHQIQAINNAVSGLAPRLLALTPSQFNANHDVLTQPRAMLLTARTDVRAARADVTTVVGVLK